MRCSQVLAAVILAATAAVSTGCAYSPPPVSDKVQQAYEQGATPPAAKKTILVTVIGDSYVAGSSMGGTGATNWTSVLSSDLKGEPEVDMTKQGLGGSGYVKRGPTGKIFSEVISSSVGPKSNAVIFFGSINDQAAKPEELREAANKAYADTKAAAPNAKLIVIGSPWTSPNVPRSVLANRDTLKEAALAAGAVWVDPIEEGWFFNQPSLIGADKTHPTDEGHAYMEKLVLPHVQPIITALRG